MKRAGARGLFSYAVFFLCLSVILFARAGEWWEAPDWRPTSSDEKAFVQNYSGEHQFLAACRQGRVDVMEYWLSQKGFSPNDEFISGYTGKKVSGLCVASQKGHTDGVKLLIKAGADVNQPWGDGATPLYMASQNSRAEAVEILIQAGADVNQGKDGGATPLFIASQKGHTEVVQILVNAKAELNQAKGATPLFIASKKGHAEVVQILVNTEGVALNQPRNDGVTPLYIAAQNGHSEVVKILLQAGADQSIKRRLNWFFTRSPRAAAKRARPFQFVDPDEWQKYTFTINTLTEYRQTYKRKRSRPVITTKDNEETPLLSEFPRLRLQSGSK